MLALLAITISSLFALRVSASALTTTIPANDKSCFYAAVDTEGEKVRLFLTLRAAVSELTTRLLRSGFTLL